MFISPHSEILPLLKDTTDFFRSTEITTKRYSLKVNLQVGLLISTRNRPEQIRKLLSSLDSQEISQVVVSASGANIEYVLNEFKSRLKLEYIHSEPGQIRQKINGLRVFKNDLDWIIFSDDDLFYPNDFISKFKCSVESADSQGLIGVGFRISNAGEVSKRLHARILNKFFLLQGGSPGSVNQSGECVSYFKGEQRHATMWLNGASAWKAEYAHTYSSIASDTKYAAYEDAIFSHQLSNAGKMMYFPELQVYYQDPKNLTQFTSLTFQSYSFWKLYFVIRFGLSFSRYIWSTLGFSFIYLANQNSNEKIKIRLRTLIDSWQGILGVLINKDIEKRIVEVLRCQLPKA